MTIQERIKLIRTEKGLTQEEFSSSIGIKRANYAQMELGKQLPSFEVVSTIVKIYNKSYQWIIEGKDVIKGVHEVSGKNVHPSVHPSVHPKGKEAHTSYPKQVVIDHVVDTKGMVLVPMMDIKAAAGSGYLNEENIDENQVMRLPVNMVRGGHHLCVSIKGTSMAPTLQDGGYVIIRLLDRGDWATMINERIYVIVDLEGKTYLKRVKNRLSGERGFIVLSSDSPDKVSNPNFNLQADEIQFIWYVEWYFTAKMPNIHDQYYNRLSNLEDTVQEMQAQFLQMKKQLK